MNDIDRRDRKESCSGHLVGDGELTFAVKGQLETADFKHGLLVPKVGVLFELGVRACCGSKGRHHQGRVGLSLVAHDCRNLAHRAVGCNDGRDVTDGLLALQQAAGW